MAGAQNGRLDRRVAIVTGAGRGIGRAIACGFAREGARVALLDVDGGALEEVRAAVAGSGVEALAHEADVTSEASVRAAVSVVRETFGRVDILVNNAGRTSASSVAEMSLAEWQGILAVDLTSVFLCSRAVVPLMMQQGSGRIINMGSQLGLCGAAHAAHYAAAKAGVHAFTKSLALEMGDNGVTVNAIAPGPIETRMMRGADPAALERLREAIPLRRFGQADEVVPTAVLLASDEGAYYTGAIFNMSGGHVMA